MEDRYDRQKKFGPIGPAGQASLASKHVVIIGAGALGSGSAEILARAGVGKLTLVDRDYVEWSNLQRQHLFEEADAIEQQPKAEAAARRLKQINSSIDVCAYVIDCSANEMERLAEGADVIVDATDNFDTRFMINDAAYKHGIPWIYGAVVGSVGMSFTFVPGRTACLHCLLGAVPVSTATCDASGVIAPAVQMVVSAQTVEALKLLSGNGEKRNERLVMFDLWNNTFQQFRISEKMSRPECSTCGEHPEYPFLRYDARMKSEVLCGRNSVSIRMPSSAPWPIEQWGERARMEGKKVVLNSYLVSIEDKEHRIVFFKDGRALIHGTDDVAAAKKWMHRYIG